MSSWADCTVGVVYFGGCLKACPSHQTRVFVVHAARTRCLCLELRHRLSKEVKATKVHQAKVSDKGFRYFKREVKKEASAEKQVFVFHIRAMAGCDEDFSSEYTEY